MARPGTSAACISAFLSLFTYSGAGAVNQTLYINAGYLQTVDTLLLPQLAFNATGQFSSRNALIRIAPGDTVIVKVVNKDSVTHGLAIRGLGTLIGSVAPGDSAVATAVFPQTGVFIYYDPTDYPSHVYLGLAGIISVEAKAQSHFYWNLHEHQPDINDSLVLGKTIDWSSYYPRYFTINGLSHPFISQDSTARIEGYVGDTLVVQIANTGRSVHSIHFHGYHATIVRSSKFPDHAGRSKDSVPIYPMETMTLRIVPDKPGEFPVHDHNLVAVSAGNYYPNGMLMTMLIAP